MNEIIGSSSGAVQVAAPSVSVFACGGTGINMGRLLRQRIGSDRVTIHYYDTSEANQRVGEEVTVIKNTGSGSGMIRGTNVGPIQKEVSTYNEDQLPLSDVNIVLFGLSGGTGSVAGPVLIDEIHRRTDGKAQIIAFGVIDLTSKTSTRNVLRTLESLELTASESGIYLPISLFDNGVGGRSNIDNSLITHLGLLISLLTQPTMEVDRNDRRAFLNRNNHLKKAPGLRVIHVTSGATGSESDTTGELFDGFSAAMFDSALRIGTEAEEVQIEFDALWCKDGRFSEPKLVPLLGVIGNAPDAFDRLRKRVSDRLNKFAAHDTDYEPTVQLSAGGKRHGRIIVDD